MNKLVENPAARLLAILEQGKEIPKDKSCREAWDTLLKTKGKSRHILFKRLGKVMKLTEDVLTQFDFLNTTERQKKAIQGCINTINLGFEHQNLLGNWETFIRYLNEPAMDTLDFTSHLFENQLNIKTSSHDEELSKIKQGIQKLLDDIVKEDGLNEDIREYLVHSLHRIIFAIDEYFISGYAPIIETIETVLGHAALDSQTENQEFMKAFQKTGTAGVLIESLNILSAIVTLTLGVPQLTENFFQFLLAKT